jgi:hypothetical protein
MMPVNSSLDGEYAGAIGAALLGRRRWDKRRAAGLETSSAAAL